MFSVELRCADLELPSMNDDRGANWHDCDAKNVDSSVNCIHYSASSSFVCPIIWGHRYSCISYALFVSIIQQYALLT